LISLGFFKTKLCTFKDTKYKNFLSLKIKNVYFYFLEDLILGIYYIIPILLSINLKKNIFLFIDLKKTNLLFLNKFYILLNSLVSFLIYDWAYGLLTNFYIIELDTYSYKSNKMPSLVFLLSLVDLQRMICKELKKKSFKCWTSFCRFL